MGELITIRMAVIAATIGLGQPGCCGDYRGWIRKNQCVEVATRVC